MKKIITILAFVALSSVSAKAVDFSVFSLTGGVAAGNSVWGATAQQDEYDSNNSGTIDTSNKESGVFTSSYGSYFYEFGIGKYVSFGYDVVEPYEQSFEDEVTYYSILLYLGPLSLIYNFGNHDWDE